MTDSRLILLEGMPSTGKTTNSRFIQIQLERQGIETEWIHEVAMPHPVLFFDEVGLTHDEYRDFIKEHPTVADILDQISVVRKNTVSVNLNLIRWYDKDLFDQNAYQALLQFDVWKFPIERYELFALDKWNCFTEQVLYNESKVYIVDSAVFQYQIFRYLFENKPYEELQNLVSQIEDIIKPLRPSLLFLYRENAEATIDYLEKDRGTAYLDNLYQRDRNQPYYRDKPDGVESFKQFLRDYSVLVNRLFNSFAGNKLSLEISKGNWTELEEKMLSFLGVKRTLNIDACAPNGIYKNNELGYVIQVEDRSIIDPEGTRRKLTPKNQNEFYVDWLPIVLRFENDGIIMAGTQISDRWSATGTRYVKAELWDAYDESGKKLGFDLVRGQQIPDGVYHLVCEVVVRRTDGDYLLMQRSWEKEVSPGNWEIGAGGSALKGEDALTGACRELLEETGIEALEGLKELYHTVHQKHHAIYQGYLLVTDWPREKIALQAGETIAYRWLSQEEFLDFYDNNPSIGSQRERLREFVEKLRRPESCAGGAV